MISIETLLYFISLTSTLLLTLYVVKQYLKVQHYEQQVDRGWKDLIDRADKMLNELNEIKSQIENKKVGRSKTK
jgi:hypothetical protein